MKKSIKSKITRISLFSIIIPVAIITSSIFYQKYQISNDVGKLLELDANSKLERVSEDIYKLLELTNIKIHEQIDASLKIGNKLIEESGGFTISNDTQNWSVTNQFTKDTKEISLPLLKLGGTNFPKSNDFRTNIPIIDENQKLAGGTFTIFQRMNDNGDMLRIATNVKLENGNRAIGTYIPATNPDGTKNKVIESVLRGDTFKGNAFVVNAWYQTAYQPFYDNLGNIIGMIYAGFKQEADESIRNHILNIKVGQTGYVYVLKGSGDEKGEYIISSNGERDGENIYDAKDADGNLFIKDLVDRSKEKENGEVIIAKYPWKNQGEEVARDKIASVNYFKSWDWVIGVSAYEEEFYQVYDRFNASMNRMIFTSVLIGVIILVIMGIIAIRFSNNLSNPIKELSDYSNKMAHGDFNFSNDIRRDDEVGELAESFREMSGNIKQVTDEVNLLIDAAIEGRLDTRCDETKFQGEYRDLIHGSNELMNSIIAPLNVTAEYVDRISKGDIPPKITEKYKGDYNEIKNNLNQLIVTLQDFTKEMHNMADKHEEGDIDVKMDISLFSGVYQEMAKGVNENVFNHIATNRKAMSVFEEYGKGNFDFNIEKLPGKKVFINEVIDSVQNNLKEFQKEISEIIQAIRNGQLDKRGNSEKFSGGWKDLVVGLNEVINAFVEPINLTAEYIDRISKGDLPPHIDNEYKGDFNEIKNNLNQLMDNLHKFISAMNKMYEDQKIGEIQSKINIDNFEGFYKQMSSGVNASVEIHIGNILKILDILKEYSEGNFAPELEKLPGKQIIANQRMDLLRSNLINIVKDINILVESVKIGNLNKRGDDSKYLGGWQELIIQFNNMIKNVETPINEMQMTLEKIAVNDFSSKVSGDYSGIWLTLKENINQVIDGLENIQNIAIEISDGNISRLELLELEGMKSINDKLQPAFINMMKAIRKMIDDLEQLSNFAVGGELSRRADSSNHYGEFRNVISQINSTLEAVVNPISEAQEILHIMSTGDITSRIEGNYQGDHEQLKISINKLSDSLSELIGQIYITVDTVSSAALEITATSENIASSAEEQSSQVDEIADTINNMSEDINKNAKNATDTAKITTSKMNEISDAVNISAEKIDKLGQSSKQIGDIIAVIDDIADQTNLLALNAAIEAARAGDLGRGFAVVADEVRKLAERTTEATKQIAQMIVGIQKDTEEAVKIMRSTGSNSNSLEQIVSQAKVELIKMIDNIAASMEHQAVSSEEIAHNISSIASVTNELTKNISDIADSSDGLSKLTEQLQDIVSKFKVNRTESSLNDMNSQKELRSKNKHLLS